MRGVVRQTDTQTYSYTNKWTGRQTDRHIGMQVEKWIVRKTIEIKFIKGKK